MLERRRALLADSKNKIHCYMSDQLRFNVGYYTTEFLIEYIEITDGNASYKSSPANWWTNGKNESVSVIDINNNFVGTMNIETSIVNYLAYIGISDVYIELPQSFSDTDTFAITARIKYERNGKYVYREAFGTLYILE